MTDAVPATGTIFSSRPYRHLPVPGVLGVLMVVVFGGIAVAFSLSLLPQVPEHPWVLLICLASFWPLGLLWLIGRLTGRYRLVIEADRSVVLTMPFRRVHLGPQDLATVTAGTVGTIVAGTAARRPVLVFTNAAGEVLAHCFQAAFSAEDLSGFLGALAQVRPEVEIVRT